MDKGGHSTDSRLARLESIVESLADDVQQITSTLKSITKTEWTTYIGFAAIILTIVGMVGGVVSWGYAKDQVRLEAIVDKLTDRALALEFARGQVTTEVESLKVLTVDLDTRLQREMRDVNATTEAKLHALDVRLQDELHRAQAATLESRTIWTDQVKKLEEFQDAAKEIHATNIERVRALERKVFANEARDVVEVGE